MLSRTKRAIKSGITSLWASAFAAGGRLTRSAVSRWESSGGRRVLVLAPHPDDEVMGCGGTVLLHGQRDDRVCIAYVTDGRRSRALGLSPQEMAQRRRREAAAAARALEVDDIEWLGLPEGEWRDGELEVAITDLLERLSPDLLYAPSRVDFHPEHYRVARCLATVLATTERRSRPPSIRIYQIQVPLTHVLTNLVAPTATVMEASLTALRQYDTQAGSVLASLRSKRYAARFYGLPGQAEEFWQLTAEQYGALHRELPPRPLVQTFRGLRPFALTDPLAYWRGRAERRRLAGLAIE